MSFNSAAEQYDSTFSQTVIGLAQRKRVWNYLDRHIDLSANVSVLELNCGTGVDAVYFARKGCHLLATDASENMLAQTQLKLAPYPNATTHYLDLKGAISENLRQQYDLIFSNFGGFNCLNKTQILSAFRGIIQALRPGGHFILIMMPPNAIIEHLYHKQKINKASDHPVRVAVGDGFVDTYYYTPQEIQEMLEEMEVRISFPTGFMPSYAYEWCERNPIAWKAIKWFENICCTFSILSKYGDHFLIHVQSRS